jgi:hypothetical protein
MGKSPEEVMRRFIQDYYDRIKPSVLKRDFGFHEELEAASRRFADKLQDRVGHKTGEMYKSGLDYLRGIVQKSKRGIDDNELQDVVNSIDEVFNKLNLSLSGK